MNESQDERGLQLALGVYVLVFVLKLAVYTLTGVIALFAEALHTLSDIFVSGFLLVAARWSRKQPDATHMFGYGRAQNVGALVAATLFISFTSFELYREAIPRLFKPAEMDYQNVPLALGVIIVSMAIAGAPLFKLLAQKTRGAAAKAQLLELINDQLGLLAALVGTILILFGQPLADPLAAIIVATIIAINAISLFRENSSYLIGRSPGAPVLTEIERRARSVPGVIAVHDLRAEFVAPNVIHAGMHITVARGTPVEHADQIAHQVEQSIHQDFPDGFCVIHVDPANAQTNADSVK